MSCKVIFKASFGKEVDLQPRWEKGCPLQIMAFQVSRDTDSGDTFFQMRVRNISSKIINSFIAKIDITSCNGLCESQEIHPLDADIPAGKDYVPAPIKLSEADISSADVAIILVSMDKEEWKTADSPEPVLNLGQSALTSCALSERRAILAEKGFSKAADVNQDLKTDDLWWTCSCGQLNDRSRKKCCNCGIDFEELAAITALTEQELLMRAKQREQEKNEKAARKKKQHKLIALGGVAVCVIALVGILFYNIVVVPNQPFSAFLGYELGDDYASFKQGSVVEYDLAYKPSSINGVSGNLYAKSKSSTIDSLFWSSHSDDKTASSKVISELEKSYGQGQSVRVPNKEGTKIGGLESTYMGTQFITPSGIIYIVGSRSGGNVYVFQSATKY